LKGDELFKEYDEILLEEIKRLFDETRDSYWYACFPDEKEVETVKRDKIERRKAVRAKLEDLIEYIDKGVFW